MDWKDGRLAEEKLPKLSEALQLSNASKFAKSVFIELEAGTVAWRKRNGKRKLNVNGYENHAQQINQHE